MSAVEISIGDTPPSLKPSLVLLFQMLGELSGDGEGNLPKPSDIWLICKKSAVQFLGVSKASVTVLTLERTLLKS